MVTLIDGKKLAESIREDIADEIAKNGYHPGLAIVLVGDDPASHLYVNLKEKACKAVGIDFHKYYLKEDVSQEKLEEVIDFLNNDDAINSLLIQLPLPDHLDEDAAIAAIHKEKDVDGFGPENMEDFMNHTALIVPGLAHSVYDLIKSTGQSLEDKTTIVLANSDIFAKPLIRMMELNGGYAEYLSPQDPHLVQKTKEADILIVALGRKHFITPAMVKEGSTIIDVGTNREGDETFGDVDPAVDDTVAYRTPVPGGVGPMTIAMLLKNTLEQYKIQHP
jgi:methylenetetrahydrofolate dehydrogenase (NADP+)/methenyltetrahydrofolate cyclohydrolase